MLSKVQKKIMPSCLMFRIVKMVWVYLWMLETCGMVHSAIISKAYVRTPIGRLWRKQKGEVALCLHLFCIMDQVKWSCTQLLTQYEKKYEASLASLLSFSDYELCLWLQGNKRLYNRGSWGKGCEGWRTSPLLNVCAAKRLRFLS